MKSKHTLMHLIPEHSLLTVTEIENAPSTWKKAGLMGLRGRCSVILASSKRQRNCQLFPIQELINLIYFGRKKEHILVHWWELNFSYFALFKTPEFQSSDHLPSRSWPQIKQTMLSFWLMLPHSRLVLSVSWLTARERKQVEKVISWKGL